MHSATAVAVLAALAAPAAAHIAMWHPSAYGFEDGNWQSERLIQPLEKSRAAASESTEWWFHGSINMPPKEGEFLELPAGDKFTVALGCGKIYSEWGPYWDSHRESDMACDVRPLLHAGYPGAGPHGTEPTDPRNVKGSAIAIAYKSDPHAVRPEDFVVVSVNHKAPFHRLADYHIPEGLPECPAGGCHCSWNWIHAMQTGGQEMYQNVFRCKVTGKIGTRALPTPNIARKCPYDKNNCTIGAKTPHVWYQASWNNNFQDSQDPPYYNDEYGFNDGAQTDLWEPDTDYRNPDWAPAPAGTWGKSYPDIPQVTPATNKPANNPPSLAAPTATSLAASSVAAATSATSVAAAAMSVAAAATSVAAASSVDASLPGGALVAEPSSVDTDAGSATAAAATGAATTDAAAASSDAASAASIEPVAASSAAASAASIEPVAASSAAASAASVAPVGGSVVTTAASGASVVPVAAGSSDVAAATGAVGATTTPASGAGVTPPAPSVKKCKAKRHMRSRARH